MLFHAFRLFHINVPIYLRVNRGCDHIQMVDPQSQQDPKGGEFGYRSEGFDPRYPFMTSRTLYLFPSDKYWCGRNEKQNHYHLLVRCEAWHPQIKASWKSGRARGWKHLRAPRVKTLFEQEEGALAVLTFLRENKVVR